jgi:hypothetical protein
VYATEQAERPQSTFFDELHAAVRTTLGEDAFASAWAEGRALSLDAAVALALEQTETPATDEARRYVT